MVLIVAILFLIEVFVPFSPPGHPEPHVEVFVPFTPPGHPEPHMPQFIVSIFGFNLMLLVFLLLNGVWIVRTGIVSIPTIIRGFLIAAWTALCVALFVIFWTPVDRNFDRHPGTSIDRWYWPYHGISESTVNLTPTAPTYRRLVIREEAEANVQGFWWGDFVADNNRVSRRSLVKLTYKLELEALRPIEGQANFEMTVDSLHGMSWRSEGNKGGKRSGIPLDAEVVAEWLRGASSSDGKPEDIDIEAHAIVGILRRAANNDNNAPRRGAETRETVSRLDAAVQREMGSSIPFNKLLPFRPWSAAESVKIEPVVPILYVGVPLTLAVWGVGVWLLLRRRRVSRVVHGTT
jgi:hypothetical protein